MNRKLIAVVVVCIVVASIVAYNQYQISQQPTGIIKVSGAFALYPLMVIWGQQYEKLHPGITVEVSAGGAGKGMADALSGLVDIGMISRQISPTEVSNGAFFVAVAEGAAVATISANNPVLQDILTHGISKHMFYNIFIAQNVTTWGQVIGDSNITTPIHVYTRSDAAGVADVWAQFLGKKGQGDLKGVGVYGDPGLIQALKQDPDGIGYNNLAYAYDGNTTLQVSGIRVVPIDLNANGMIDSNENFYENKSTLVQAIKENIYPTPPAQVLYLVTKGQFTGITKDFVKWILTDGQSYVNSAGYVQLSSDTINSQLAKLGS